MSLELPLTTIADEIHELKQTLLRSGRRIFDLAMINPDIPPQRLLLDRLSEATINPKNHKYTVAKGIRKCREAFAAKYLKAFNVNLDLETEICITLGSKDGISTIFQTLPPNGRYALLPSPTYPAHLATAELAGYKIINFRLGDEQEMLSGITKAIKDFPIRVILLNFPSNPTGQTVSPEFYQKLGKLLDGTDIIVINDFVYGEMGYEQRFSPSLLFENSLKDRSVEVYSLSKAYCVPGWRIGAVLGASSIVDKVSRVKGLVDYGVFLPIQIAASFALTTDEKLVESTVSEYRSRAKIVCDSLRSIGWEVLVPKAGACVWTKPIIKESNPTEWVTSLLVDHGISILPGEIFGEEWRDWVRIALVSNEEILRGVMDTFRKLSSIDTLAEENSKFYV